MTAAIWVGAGTASDVLFLVAAVIAMIDVTWMLTKAAPEAALLPAAVVLIALGLLAL
jgi:hypothetical protein